MRMCDGDGKSVGSIGRQVFPIPAIACCNHGLYLSLVGMTVAGHGLFNAVGEIFADREASLRQGEDRGATRLA